MTEPTQGVPPVVGPPPPDPPPGTPPPPVPPVPGGPDDPGADGEGPDRRVVAIGALLALIAVLLIALIIVRTGDDGDEVTADSSTTTTTSTSTTTSSTSTSTSSSTTTSSTTTTTTAPPTTAPTTTRPTTTTTTTAPPPTIAPARCTGATAPDDPDPVARTFYDAWRVDDRSCAEAIGAPDAIEDLFALDGSSTEWTFEACEPDTDGDGEDPSTICTFRYEGGTAFFQLRFGATDGWQVTAIAFQVD